MITAPSNWDAIYAMPDATLDVRMTWTRGGINFTLTNSDLSSSGVTIEHSVSNNLSYGNVAMARLTFTVKDYADNINNFLVYTPSQGGTYLTLECLCRSELHYKQTGIRRSGWADLGLFIIAELNALENNDLEVIAYDLIMVSELKPQYYNLPVTPSNIRTITGLNLSSSYLSTPFTSDSRIADFSLSKDVAREKGLSGREQMAIMAQWSGSNLAIKRSTRALDFLRPYQLSSTYYGYSTRSYGGTQSDGAECTCSSLTVSNPYVLQNVAVKQGENEYKSGISEYGTFFKYDVDDYLATMTTQQAARIKSYAFGGDNWNISSVVAQGVVVTPLFELGDVLTVITGGVTEKPYFNFIPWAIRININGLCYGDFSAEVSFDQFFDEMPVNTTGLTEATLPDTQTPTFTFMGEHSFGVSINTNTSRGGYDVARFTQYSLSNFTVTYEDYANEQHTVTISSARMADVNALLSTNNSSKACVENAVYITSTVLPRARDVKSVVSTSLVLYPYSSSATNNRIRMYLG